MTISKSFWYADDDCKIEVRYEDAKSNKKHYHVSLELDIGYHATFKTYKEAKLFMELAKQSIADLKVEAQVVLDQIKDEDIGS